MKWLRSAGVVLSAGGIGMYGIYHMVFGRNGKNQGLDNEIPQGKQYDPYAEVIRKGVEKASKMSYQRIFIQSRDGITLSAKYYQGETEAPLIIFFHGYRSSALRDGNGMLLFAKKNGYHVLMVDQRGHGKSGGKTITFGIKERYDCLDWIKYVNYRFGNHKEIILAGISMGASTVLMASSLGLPENVKGIMADCPYSSPKEILKAVMKQLRFPVNVTYRTVKLAAKIFGGFDVEEYSAVEAMKYCRVPLLLIHGEEDYFVPCEMGKACYETCSSEQKKFILVKGAAHGMSYCVDGDLYERELIAFFQKILDNEKIKEDERC